MSAGIANGSGWEQTRKRELALIHMAKAHLGLSRDDYEFVIRQVTGTGKTSAADLTDAERHQLLQHFKSKGFTVKAKPRESLPLREPQHRKLRAMWYELAERGAVVRPASALACEEAIEAWAKRQINQGKHADLGQLDALRFASKEQLHKLIEEMKAWCARAARTPS